LKAEIKKNPENKLRTQHPAVDSFSRKHFSPANKELLLNLFKAIHQPEPTFPWKKSVLDNLRRLNEALVDTIPFSYYSAPYTLDAYLEKVKRDSSNRKANKGNRTMSIIEFFHNNELYVPDPVDYTIRNIYDAASKFAAHSEETESNYYPSTEMIIGLVYSHFGCYHWFNQIIKN
jgi:hypothetical protein